MRLYGYNEHKHLLLWHKSFGVKADSPCRLDSLFIQENKPIKIATNHKTLPLFLTVTTSNESEFISISYEHAKSLSHAGYYILKQGIIMKDLYWIDYLPLIFVLSNKGKIYIIGPYIEKIEEDISSYLSVLRYSINSQNPYTWKEYFSNEFSETNTLNILHIQTFYDTETDSYTEYCICLEDKGIFNLMCFHLENTVTYNDLAIRPKLKAQYMEYNEKEPIKSWKILKYPINKSDSFKFCMEADRQILIFSCNIPAKNKDWKCEQISKINLGEDISVTYTILNHFS